MPNTLAALLGAAVVGLCAAGSVSAAPISAVRLDTVAAVMPQATNVGWQNVCRDRNIMRRDRFGNVVRFQVPMCNMVWIGKRYYYRGNYYADPDFVAQIY